MFVQPHPFLALVASIVLHNGLICAAEPPPSSMTAGDIKAELKQRHEEISAKFRSPVAPAGWKELSKLQNDLRVLSDKQRTESAAFEQKLQTEQRPLHAKEIELSKLPDVAKWQSEIDRLPERIWALQREENRLTRVEGKQLYEARHASLAKQATEVPNLRMLGFDALTLPYLDGSTSTQPLATLIACKCLSCPYGWVGEDQLYADARLLNVIDSFRREPIPYEPELKLLEFTLQASSTTPENRRLAVIINRLIARNGSTHHAYVNLIEGRSDIALMARPPSADELALARQKNVELETTPCAWDAFVFLVHENNLVRQLTSDQLREIYSGKTRDWKDVGGKMARITAYQREDNSGSQELMRKLVMKDIPLEKPNDRYDSDLIGYIMSSPYLQLTNNSNGIGYSVYYYEQFMSGSPRTRVIAVDGVEPNSETIRTRKYPYACEVLAVTRKGVDKSAPAIRLRDWLLSPEGQSVVRESGYVPVPVER